MNKIFRRRSIIQLVPVLLLAILCMFMFSSVAAAEIKMSISAKEATETSEYVTGRKGKGGYVLCIPGTWDITRIQLSAKGHEKFQLDKNGPILDADTPVDLTEYVGRKVQVFSAKHHALGTLVIYQGSKIPAVFFTVDSKQLKKVNQSKKENITEGRVVFQEADGSISYDGDLTLLKGRGNNTFSYAKKPYEFKLAKKADLCGMGKAKTWILLANYLDVSMLRNQIVLDLSREVGLPYSVKCRQTDVWLNGVYNGMYLMTEKIQINKNRINITDLEEKTEAVNDQPLDTYPKYNPDDGFLPIMRGYKIPNNPEDITGGYIVTIEKPHRLKDSTKPGIRTKKQLSIRIKEPTYPSEAQVAYLGKLFNDMHNAVLAADGVNQDTGKHYTEYLDTVSFARKYLVEDMSKNYDAAGGSQYLFKDSDLTNPLIYAGPSWDYDLSFGNMDVRGASPVGEYMSILKVGSINFFGQLAKHEEFKSEVKKNWRDVFRPAVAILMGEVPATESSEICSFEQYYELLKDSAKMNEIRWGKVTKLSKYAGSDFDSGVRSLKNWIQKRINSMDEVFAE